MDYLLGILTGIGICLIYGNYLLHQRKKEQAQQVNRIVDAWFRTFHSHSPTLEHQLQDAIEREDFQEAARLRDLINKK